LGGEFHVQVASESLLDELSQVLDSGFGGGVLVGSNFFGFGVVLGDIDGGVALVSTRAFGHTRWRFASRTALNHEVLVECLLAKVSTAAGDAITGVLPESLRGGPEFAGVDDC
jgi:hypothetical protein